jgi:hypothetical protein
MAWRLLRCFRDLAAETADRVEVVSVNAAPVTMRPMPVADAAAPAVKIAMVETPVAYWATVTPVPAALSPTFPTLLAVRHRFTGFPSGGGWISIMSSGPVEL